MAVEAYVACLAGAILRHEYLGLIEQAGFSDVSVTESRSFSPDDVVAEDLVAEFVAHAHTDRASLDQAASRFASTRVSALKPA